MAYYTAFAIVAVIVCLGMSIPLKMNRAGLFAQDARVPAITATQLRKRQLSYQTLVAQAEKYGAPEPVPDCRLVCVSKYPTATYSGMLPGTLAGQFSEKEMQIDLTRLTQ